MDMYLKFKLLFLLNIIYARNIKVEKKCDTAINSLEEKIKPIRAI